MNKKFNIAVTMLAALTFSACQQAPAAENVDGIYVESQGSLIQEAGSGENTGQNDAAQGSDSQEQGTSDVSVPENMTYTEDEIIISAESGQIHISLSDEDMTEEIEASKGTLEKKSYDFETLQAVFCPEADLVETDFAEGILCMAEYNGENTGDPMDWNQYLMIGEEPYVDFSYTYAPLDDQNERIMERTEGNDADEEALAAEIRDYLSELGSSYTLTSSICYGDGSWTYYDFDLVCTINGYSCITDGTDDASVWGNVQINEYGIGCFNVGEDFSIKESEPVTLISQDETLKLLAEYVSRKQIAPQGDVSISDVALEYKISRSEDGTYIFYPVWNFKRTTEGGAVVSYAAFNAENGEVEYYSRL